ncbi:hypothetical protein DVH24_026925 [Malus domestica]|uniref:DC-UbP/UBTD2 N-terminal domain-containing protein n=1 Tax=Malus domestica TaxID=3750 RepID=A0A498IL01_MALDO|nr:hypothetical protein DVH24_026925 [Malus domestica]
MGCAGSSQTKGDGTLKKIRKPKPWKHPQPLTKSQLLQMREEFWDTAPHYGGRKEVALGAMTSAFVRERCASLFGLMSVGWGGGVGGVEGRSHLVRWQVPSPMSGRSRVRDLGAASP